PSPQTFLIDDPAQLDALPMTFPLILKPLALGNGEGVQRVESDSEIDKYLGNGHRAARLPLLAQELIPGSDIVFGILADKGKLLAWTIHERKPDWIRFFRHDAMLELGRS